MGKVMDFSGSGSRVIDASTGVRPINRMSFAGEHLADVLHSAPTSMLKPRIPTIALLLTLVPSVPDPLMIRSRSSMRMRPKPT